MQREPEMVQRRPEWEEQLESIDSQELEIHQSQLRLMRDQTAVFVRDLEALRREVLALRSVKSDVQSLEANMRELKDSATLDGAKREASRARFEQRLCGELEQVLGVPLRALEMEPGHSPELVAQERPHFTEASRSSLAGRVAQLEADARGFASDKLGRLQRDINEMRDVVGGEKMARELHDSSLQSSVEALRASQSQLAKRCGEVEQALSALQDRDFQGLCNKLMNQQLLSAERMDQLEASLRAKSEGAKSTRQEGELLKSSKKSEVALAAQSLRLEALERSAALCGGGGQQVADRMDYLESMMGASFDKHERMLQQLTEDVRKAFARLDEALAERSRPAEVLAASLRLEQAEGLKALTGELDATKQALEGRLATAREQMQQLRGLLRSSSERHGAEYAALQGAEARQAAGLAGLRADVSMGLDRSLAVVREAEQLRNAEASEVAALKDADAKQMAGLQNLRENVNARYSELERDAMRRDEQVQQLKGLGSSVEQQGAELLMLRSALADEQLVRESTRGSQWSGLWPSSLLCEAPKPARKESLTQITAQCESQSEKLGEMAEAYCILAEENSTTEELCCDLRQRLGGLEEQSMESRSSRPGHIGREWESINQLRQAHDDIAGRVAHQDMEMAQSRDRLAGVHHLAVEAAEASQRAVQTAQHGLDQLRSQLLAVEGRQQSVDGRRDSLHLELADERAAADARLAALEGRLDSVSRRLVEVGTERAREVEAALNVRISSMEGRLDGIGRRLTEAGRENGREMEARLEERLGPLEARLEGLAPRGDAFSGDGQEMEARLDFIEDMFVKVKEELGALKDVNMVEASLAVANTKLEQLGGRVRTFNVQSVPDKSASGDYEVLKEQIDSLSTALGDSEARLADELSALRDSLAGDLSLSRREYRDSLEVVKALCLDQTRELMSTTTPSLDLFDGEFRQRLEGCEQALTEVASRHAETTSTIQAEFERIGNRIRSFERQHAALEDINANASIASERTAMEVMYMSWKEQVEARQNSLAASAEHQAQAQNKHAKDVEELRVMYSNQAKELKKVQESKEVGPDFSAVSRELEVVKKAFSDQAKDVEEVRTMCADQVSALKIVKSCGVESSEVAQGLEAIRATCAQQAKEMEELRVMFSSQSHELQKISGDVDTGPDSCELKQELEVVKKSCCDQAKDLEQVRRLWADQSKVQSVGGDLEAMMATCAQQTKELEEVMAAFEGQAVQLTSGQQECGAEVARLRSDLEALKATCAALVREPPTNTALIQPDSELSHRMAACERALSEAGASLADATVQADLDMLRRRLSVLERERPAPEQAGEQALGESDLMTICKSLQEEMSSMADSTERQLRELQEANLHQIEELKSTITPHQALSQQDTTLADVEPEVRRAELQAVSKELEALRSGCASQAKELQTLRQDLVEDLKVATRDFDAVRDTCAAQARDLGLVRQEMREGFETTSADLESVRAASAEQARVIQSLKEMHTLDSDLVQRIESCERALSKVGSTPAETPSLLQADLEHVGNRVARLEEEQLAGQKAQVAPVELPASERKDLVELHSALQEELAGKHSSLADAVQQFSQKLETLWTKQDAQNKQATSFSDHLDRVQSRVEALEENMLSSKDIEAVSGDVAAVKATFSEQAAELKAVRREMIEGQEAASSELEDVRASCETQVDTLRCSQQDGEGARQAMQRDLQASIEAVRSACAEQTGEIRALWQQCREGVDALSGDLEALSTNLDAVKTTCAEQAKELRSARQESTEDVKAVRSLCSEQGRELKAFQERCAAQDAELSERLDGFQEGLAKVGADQGQAASSTQAMLQRLGNRVTSLEKETLLLGGLQETSASLADGHSSLQSLCASLKDEADARHSALADSSEKHAAELKAAQARHGKDLEAALETLQQMSERLEAAEASLTSCKGSLAQAQQRRCEDSEAFSQDLEAVRGLCLDQARELGSLAERQAPLVQRLQDCESSLTDAAMVQSQAAATLQGKLECMGSRLAGLERQSSALGDLWKAHEGATGEVAAMEERWSKALAESGQKQVRDGEASRAVQERLARELEAASQKHSAAAERLELLEAALRDSDGRHGDALAGVQAGLEKLRGRTAACERLNAELQRAQGSLERERSALEEMEERLVQASTRQEQGMLAKLERIAARLALCEQQQASQEELEALRRQVRSMQDVLGDDFALPSLPWREPMTALERAELSPVSPSSGGSPVKSPGRGGGTVEERLRRLEEAAGRHSRHVEEWRQRAGHELEARQAWQESLQQHLDLERAGRESLLESRLKSFEEALCRVSERQGRELESALARQGDLERHLDAARGRGEKLEREAAEDRAAAARTAAELQGLGQRLVPLEVRLQQVSGERLAHLEQRFGERIERVEQRVTDLSSGELVRLAQQLQDFRDDASTDRAKRNKLDATVARQILELREEMSTETLKQQVESLRELATTEKAKRSQLEEKVREAMRQQQGQEAELRSALDLERQAREAQEKLVSQQLSKESLEQERSLERLQELLSRESEQQERRFEGYEASLQHEAKAREASTQELRELVARERQARERESEDGEYGKHLGERLQVLQRSLAICDTMMREEIEVRSKETKRLWDAVNAGACQAPVGEEGKEGGEAEATDTYVPFPCQPLTSFLRLGGQNLPENERRRRVRLLSPGAQSREGRDRGE